MAAYPKLDPRRADFTNRRDETQLVAGVWEAFALSRTGDYGSLRKWY